MLKKINRLPKFGKIEDTKNVRLDFFSLKYQDIKQENPRFAFIVSKQVDKKATLRNKTRRRFQKAVKEIIKEVLPFTYLIVVKRESIDKDQAEISKTVREVFKKENLFK